VHFYLGSGQQTLWLTSEGVVFDLLRAAKGPRPTEPPPIPRRQRPIVPQERFVFAQEFVGGNRAATLEPARAVPTAYNYYLGEDGSLVIRTAFGELKESAPTIYQDVDGRRVPVVGRFKVVGPAAYTFEVGPYLPQYALVIDPTLVYATYLGGTASDDAGAVAV